MVVISSACSSEYAYIGSWALCCQCMSIVSATKQEPSVGGKTGIVDMCIVRKGVDEDTGGGLGLAMVLYLITYLKKHESDGGLAEAPSYKAYILKA